MNQEFAMFQFQSFKALIFRLLLPMLFLCGGANAHATTSYTVSPMVIDLKSEARDIVEKEITITNTGTAPVTIYPSVNNISLQEGGTIDKFLAPVESDRTTSLASWLEISRLGIDLQSGAAKTVKLTVRVTPNPVPGTYHAFIGFGNGGNRDEAEKQVVNGQAPGIVVTLTIADDTNEFLKLSKFIVSRFVTKVDNQAAVFTFTNPGDEVLVPQGEIILYDSTGKEVGTMPVNNENVSISPGGEYTFTGAVPTKGLFGKYKAFLSVEYGTTQRASIQDTSFFYVFPLKLLLIFLAGCILLVAVLAWYVHKKYFGEDDLDDHSERLTVHVRDSQSEPKHHDVDLTHPSKTP
ncbi:hypothetical protein IPH92_01575 [Candidatus Kaiserbacteria bacterium]|nr:MAG: hypothetical protein IPH92_01575 [Candidatus Kaiserbacteria bacterium]